MQWINNELITNQVISCFTFEPICGPHPCSPWTFLMNLTVVTLCNLILPDLHKTYSEYLFFLRFKLRLLAKFKLQVNSVKYFVDEKPVFFLCKNISHSVLVGTNMWEFGNSVYMGTNMWWKWPWFQDGWCLWNYLFCVSDFDFISFAYNRNRN